MLSKIIESYPPAVGGGREIRTFEKNDFACCVRVVGLSSQVLGSGVAVARNWVVTAAHVVASSPKELHVDWGQYTTPIRVVAIHWHGEEGLSWRQGGKWPEAAQFYCGDKDRLALMEIESPVGMPNYAAPNLPPEVSDPTKPHALGEMEQLALAGFGVDSAGNYAHAVRVALMNYVGTCLSTPDAGIAGPDSDSGCLPRHLDSVAPVLRHVAIADLNSDSGGLPRHDDSGAPVFRMVVGDEKLKVLVCGIHASRGKAGDCTGLDVYLPSDETVSRFLPVGPDEARWIRGKTEATQTIFAPKPGLTEFVLRKRFHCLSMPELHQFAINGKKWHMVAVHSNSGQLKNLDLIEFQLRGEDSWEMKITHKDEQTEPKVIAMSRGGTGYMPAETLWLHGTKDDVEFFVFHRTNCKVRMDDGQLHTKRRIRVEVFVKGSSHVRPSIHNIYGGDPMPERPVERPLPAASQASALPPLIDLFSDDQDDEGEGYED
jgi:hypothetical protein